MSISNVDHSDERWQVLTQSEVTAKRAAIKGTLSPNEVREAGSQGHSNDFEIWPPHLADDQGPRISSLSNSQLSHMIYSV